MKFINFLINYFKQDPYKKEIKKELKKLNKKIANTKDYDEMLKMCREYKLIEQKLKAQKN